MIGSLAYIKTQLERNLINDFKSLKDVIDFKDSFAESRQELVSLYEKQIDQEKEQLKSELQQLEEGIKSQRQFSQQQLTNEIEDLKQQLNAYSGNSQINLFKRLAWKLKRFRYRQRIERREAEFEIVVERSVENLLEVYRKKDNRYQFIVSQFHQAVEQSGIQDLSALDRKKRVIDGLDSFIFGAIGEQKVVKVLEELSDDYYLINDFSVSFSPAIYNRHEKYYISSIQIDHILVAPAGIFLIETKNWSKKSMVNLNLRSPVQQIKRASYALFKLLNQGNNSFQTKLGQHHWGDRKITVKNLIVMINSKPKEEFQYVKVLGVNELLSYIQYFEPIYSGSEVKKVADFLLFMNDRKTIMTK